MNEPTTAAQLHRELDQTVESEGLEYALRRYFPPDYAADLDPELHRLWKAYRLLSQAIEAHIGRAAPPQERWDEEARELEALLELARLDADQAVAELDARLRRRVTGGMQLSRVKIDDVEYVRARAVEGEGALLRNVAGSLDVAWAVADADAPPTEHLLRHLAASAKTLRACADRLDQGARGELVEEA